MLETVEMARRLIRRGVKATVARDVVERLADGRPAVVVVPHHDRGAMKRELAALGVGVTAPRTIDGAALARLRKKLAMSQERFANSVGIEVRTLQNWERNASGFDGPTTLLIKLMEQYPDIVSRVANEDERQVNRRA